MRNANPRPKKYASAAERQAAFRARFVTVPVRLDATTADTLTRLASSLDVPRTEVMVNLIKHALLGGEPRNWAIMGLRRDLLTKGLVQREAKQRAPKLRALKLAENDEVDE
jgi:hypothetical protein